MQAEVYGKGVELQSLQVLPSQSSFVSIIPQSSEHPQLGMGLYFCFVEIEAS